MKRSHPMPVALGAALLLTACGDAGDARVPARAAPPPAAAAATPPPPPTPSASPTTPPSPPATLAEALASGRAAARAGRHAEALASMQRALALSPRSARLRCETGFVAFRAGEVELAGRLVTEALGSFPTTDAVPEALRVPLAMCRYNAGLVYVARRRTEEARDAFTSSLALRENATVRRALDALPPPPPAPLRPELPLDDAALRERLVAEFCADTAEYELVCRAAAAAERSDGEALLVSARMQPPSGTAASGVEAGLVVLRGDMGNGELERYVLVVTSRGRREAATMDEIQNFGLGGETSAVQIERFEWIDVVPGGAPELVLVLSSNQNDEDPGLCARSGGNTSTLVVCDATDGTARCAAMTLRDDAYYETDGDCEGAEDEASSERTGYAFEPRFEAGQLVLTPAADGPRGARAPFPLRRPILELLSDEASRWPRP